MASQFGETENGGVYLIKIILIIVIKYIISPIHYESGKEI